MVVTPEKALAKLLHELFDADEFRVFLRGFHDGEKLIAALAGKNATTELLFSDAVPALRRRGILDADFFAALVRERPRREADIVRVAKQWVRRFIPPSTTEELESFFEVVPVRVVQLPPDPPGAQRDSRSALEAKWVAVGRSRTPRVPALLADGRDGFLSDARWRQRKGTGTVDLVAILYDPDGELMGDPRGTVIGTIERVARSSWNFLVPAGIFDKGGRGGSNHVSHEGAKGELLDSVAHYAEEVRTVLIAEDEPSQDVEVHGVQPRPRVNVLLKGFHNVEAWVGEVWWQGDGDDKELVARVYAAEQGDFCLGEGLKGTLIGSVVHDGPHWLWSARKVPGDDHLDQGPARDGTAAREHLLDALDKIVPGIRGLVLPGRPPPFIRTRGTYRN